MVKYFSCVLNTFNQVYIYYPKFCHSTENITKIISQDFFKCQHIHSICAIDAGRFESISTRNDFLIIGSKYGILIYDPINNVDIFWKELKNNGVNTMLYKHFDGQYRQHKNTDIIFIGGYCSLIALNSSGAELFWTVTGDVISAITCLSYENNEGYVNDIVVGSEDCTVRIFRNESIVQELSETDVVTRLVSLGEEYFGYGLRNGTIGVYNKVNRIWRIKSKNKPICFIGHDINQDGCEELICGWDNGKIDARLRSNGVVILKIQLDACVAGMAVGDYYGFCNILLICTVEGDIQCFSLHKSKNNVTLESSEDALRHLITKRQNLLLEIQSINENKCLSELSKTEIQRSNVSVIKANTELQTKLEVSPNKPCVNLTIQTNNNTPLRCVVLFAEGIFNEESYVVHPPENNSYTSSFLVELKPTRDMTTDLFIRAYAMPLIRSSDRNSYYLLSCTQLLPQFCLYRLLSQNSKLDYQTDLNSLQSTVFFVVHERPQRLAIWLNQNFILETNITVDENSTLSVVFEELRPARMYIPTINQTLNNSDIKQQNSSERLLHIIMTSKGEITIKTDNLELAANLLQSISRYFNITELSSICNFPKLFNTLEELIEMSNSYSSTQQQALVEMTSKSETIKELIVKAEDYRLNGNWKSLKKTIQLLSAANHDILSNYYSRMTDYEASNNCLKCINQIIEHVSSLRVGKYKTNVINMCRNALKENNIGALKKIIRTGSN
ncbi:Bardet-Biedl syndrome 2 protein like [Schistosoma japonicum]|nr:Bardet-Biedl syndrome 2 protein like [Schistosoma japonicum]